MSEFTTTAWDRVEAERVANEMKEGRLTARETYLAINNFAIIGWEFALPLIEAALDHENAVVRISALSALAFTYSSDRRLPRIVEMFRSDEDIDVRCNAAVTLGMLCRGGKHPEIREMVVSTIRDTNEEASVRNAAYRGYLNLLDIPASARGPIPEDSEDLSVIDWDLIN